MACVCVCVCVCQGSSPLPPSPPPVFMNDRVNPFYRLGIMFLNESGKHDIHHLAYHISSSSSSTIMNPFGDNGGGIAGLPGSGDRAILVGVLDPNLVSGVVSYSSLFGNCNLTTTDRFLLDADVFLALGVAFFFSRNLDFFFCLRFSAGAAGANNKPESS